VVRPPMPAPVCRVGRCEDGFARTCDDDPRALLCSEFGAECGEQTDFETGEDFTWCDCGDIAEGDGMCLSGSLGVVCSFGLGALSDCGPGRDCAPNPGSPFGIRCQCNDLPDGICPGSDCTDDPDCASCVPNCDGRSCGDNDCGGTCGECALAEACSVTGSCEPVCLPRCDGRACGDDGCGGSCGGCGTGARCDEGACVDVCVPACDGATCGDNGCGGICGACEGGLSCGGRVCLETCSPSCGDRVCGDDGCGGSCGACVNLVCTPEGQCEGACTPACGGRSCGSDGCGGTCGTCGTGETCDGFGRCQPPCVPSCEGRACGDDGCGGTCGTAGCPDPLVCFDGDGVCACGPSAHDVFSFDGSSLTFTPSAPDLLAGAVLVASIDVTRAPIPASGPEYSRTAFVVRSDASPSVLVPGCSPDVTITTDYAIIDAAADSYIECQITQTFTGITAFTVEAPSFDAGSDTCTATGLVPR
ncbi:MAG: hypothetical protein AB8I08_17690, partial [Sandaracinaceae bacterium]